jgi:hypothetical protein
VEHSVIRQFDEQFAAYALAALLLILLGVTLNMTVARRIL